MRTNPLFVSTSTPTIEDIVHAHTRPIRKAIRKAGVADSDVDDVQQDALLRIHTALPRFDPSRPLRPWLVVLAYRTAIEHRRRAKRQPYSTEEIETMREQQTEEQTPEQQAVAREAERVFIAAAEKIPEEQRIVFLMHTVDELSIREIAEALEIPEGTAASRLQRGKAVFEAEIARLRRAEEERLGSALVPIYLTSVPALLKLNREVPEPEVSPEEIARILKRFARETAKGPVEHVLARLTELTAKQVLGRLVLATALGAGVGGAIVYALLHPRDAGASSTTAGEIASPPAPATVQGAPVLATAIPVAAVLEADAGAGRTVTPEQAERMTVSRTRAALQQGDGTAALRELARYVGPPSGGTYPREREQLRRQALALLDAGQP